MYGIYTDNGALLTRFKADTFEQAMAVMEYIIDHRAALQTAHLNLCKIF